MKLEEILRNKGHHVETITESQTVLDAVKVLVDRNIGGLVVMEGQRPTGILTERTSLGSLQEPRRTRLDPRGQRYDAGDDHGASARPSGRHDGRHDRKQDPSPPSHGRRSTCRDHLDRRLGERLPYLGRDGDFPTSAVHSGRCLKCHWPTPPNKRLLLARRGSRVQSTRLAARASGRHRDRASRIANR